MISTATAGNTRKDTAVFPESLLELIDIDIQNNNMTFNHYSGHLPSSVECLYPEIIEYSFDIKWN